MFHKIDQESAKIISKILLDIGCINLQMEPSYTLTSGRKSPIYIDCRKIISFPRARRKIISLASNHILNCIGYESFDSIIGGETAGIPYAAWLSEALQLPMQYIRKTPKNFGKKNYIEGSIEKVKKALLVEDLATDGASKLKFINSIRKMGIECKHTFVIFFYNIFPNTLIDLKKSNINLHYLVTLSDVLNVAEEHQYFTPKIINFVRSYLDKI